MCNKLSVTQITAALLDGMAASYKEKHHDCDGVTCHHAKNEVDGMEPLVKAVTESDSYREILLAAALATTKNIIETRDAPGALLGFATWAMSEGWRAAGVVLESEELAKRVGHE